MFRNIYLISIFLLLAVNEVKSQFGRNHFPLGCLCPPVSVSSQPVSPAPVCAGNGLATFNVSLNGPGPFIFRWRENGVLLSDGGSYSGTNTAALIITNPPSSLHGKMYQCIITNCAWQSEVTNSVALLSVFSLPGDLTQDGAVNSGDFAMLNRCIIPPAIIVLET